MHSEKTHLRASIRGSDFVFKKKSNQPSNDLPSLGILGGPDGHEALCGFNHAGQMSSRKTDIRGWGCPCRQVSSQGDHGPAGTTDIRLGAHLLISH